MTNMKMLLTEVDELREENTKLRNEVGDFQQEIRALRKQVIKLEAENKALREQLPAKQRAKAREFFRKIDEIEKSGGIENFLADGGEIPIVSKL